MGIEGKDFQGLNFAGANSLELARVQVAQARADAVKNNQITNKTSVLATANENNVQAAKINDAATQFEALLLHQMFQSMWSTVSSEGMLSNSKEEQYYRDMLTEGLANSVAKGQGIGIKEVIAKEMYKTQGTEKTRK